MKVISITNNKGGVGNSYCVILKPFYFDFVKS